MMPRLAGKHRVGGKDESLDGMRNVNWTMVSQKSMVLSASMVHVMCFVGVYQKSCDGAVA